MLIVTRKQGERLVIGGQTEVIVLCVRGRRVKLGISGPKEVTVFRPEAQRRIPRPVAASESADLPPEGQVGL